MVQTIDNADGPTAIADKIVAQRVDHSTYIRFVTVREVSIACHYRREQVHIAINPTATVSGQVTEQRAVTDDQESAAENTAALAVGGITGYGAVADGELTGSVN